VSRPPYVAPEVESWTTSDEYTEAHQIAAGMLPKSIHMDGLPGPNGITAVDFKLVNHAMKTYVNKGMRLVLRPYTRTVEGKKVSAWGLYYYNEIERMITVGSQEVLSPFVIEVAAKNWIFVTNTKGVERTPPLTRECQLFPRDGWVMRQNDVAYYERDNAMYFHTQQPASNGRPSRATTRSTRSELYPLPLQPRRLLARPGPAQWDCGESVDMAGVLASLAEIKRALNDARALGSPPPTGAGHALACIREA
jgi:hypothetical protein